MTVQELPPLLWRWLTLTPMLHQPTVTRALLSFPRGRTLSAKQTAVLWEKLYQVLHYRGGLLENIQVLYHMLNAMHYNLHWTIKLLRQLGRLSRSTAAAKTFQETLDMQYPEPEKDEKNTSMLPQITMRTSTNPYMLICLR